MVSAVIIETKVRSSIPVRKKNIVGFEMEERRLFQGAGGSTTVKIEEVRREERRLRRIIGFQEDEERRGFIEQLRMDTSWD